MKTERAPEVVIVTASQDRHAFMVRWALEQKGARASFFFPVATLCGETVSIDISAARFSARVGKTFPFEGIPGALWLRRLAPRVRFPEELDPKEHAIVAAQAYYLHHGLLTSMASKSFAVNSLAGHYRANLKIEQLRLAAEAGLEIPATLISNDPDDVRAFARGYQSVICKGLGLARWEGDGRFRAHATARLSDRDLDREESIRACPAIYQEELTKDFEARVTVMGRSVFCAYIRSQDHPDTQLDWRVRRDLTPLLHEGEVPAAIRERIFAVMDGLGIVFGTFDFVIDTAGQWRFLEVNEAGQFLWVEHSLPNVPLLDAFCSFLLSGEAGFEYKAPDDPVRLAGYKTEDDTVAVDINARFMSLAEADVAGAI